MLSASLVKRRSIGREARNKSGGALLGREDQHVDRVLRSDRLEVRIESGETRKGGQASDEELEELLDHDTVLWDGRPDLVRRRLDGRTGQLTGARLQGKLARARDVDRLVCVLGSASGGGGGALPGARGNWSGGGVERSGTLHDGDRCSGGDGDVVKVIRRALISICD